MFICLKGVSGCLPPRLRNELIWNGTANLVGKPGHNIALDLLNEFLNNEFKCKYLNPINVNKITLTSNDLPVVLKYSIFCTNSKP